MPDYKPMTVRQLIAQLRKCPPDDPVVLFSDEEGNGTHHVYEVKSAIEGEYEFTMIRPRYEEVLR